MRQRMVKTLILLLVAAAASSCAILGTRPAGIGKAVPWDKLPGWSENGHAGAWPALLQSCRRLKEQDGRWQELCLDASLMIQPNDATARAFFESRFVAHEIRAKDGGREGLITGYYEPLLYGSRKRTEEYRYPIYSRPDDLLVIDLGSLYEDLKGRRIRGRLLDGSKRVVPYYSREQIVNGNTLLRGNEIAWVNDPVALFFLQIQGSGRIYLTDGTQLAVGYADQNGHPYVAIGRRLIEMGVFTPEEMSLQAIRGWLQDNPDQAEELLNSNPSYVFFVVRDAAGDGPIGSLGVPLTPARSIAVDREYIALGLPVWLITTLPGAEEGLSWKRLVFAQDTGGAIRGPVRADLFWGQGEQAEELAGRMRQPGRLYVLLPAGPESVAVAANTAS